MNASRILAGLATVVISLIPLASNAHEQGRAVSSDDQIVAVVRQLPEADLKSFYLRCSNAALMQTLSGTGIKYCAYGYEELVKRVYRHDFHAFLAWSQSQSTTEEAFERAAAKPARR